MLSNPEVILTQIAALHNKYYKKIAATQHCGEAGGIFR
jgi:hypothetical protein